MLSMLMAMNNVVTWLLAVPGYIAANRECLPVFWSDSVEQYEVKKAPRVQELLKIYITAYAVQALYAQKKGILNRTEMTKLLTIFNLLVERS